MRGRAFSVEASGNKIMGTLNPGIGKFLRDNYFFPFYFCTTVQVKACTQFEVQLSV